jgi:hypothetical protein
MTIVEAKELISQRTYFDYLKGRVMKVNLKGDILDATWYDRDIGNGAAKAIVDALRVGHEPPKSNLDLAKELDHMITNATPTKVDGATITLGIGDPEIIEALESRRQVFKSDPE